MILRLVFILDSLLLGIVGGNSDGLKLFQELQKIPWVSVAVVCDSDENSPGIIEASKFNVPTTNSLKNVLDIPNLDLLLVTGERELVRDELHNHDLNNIFVLDEKGIKLLTGLLEEKKEQDCSRLLTTVKKTTQAVESSVSRVGKISGSKYCFEDLVGVSKYYQTTIELGKKAAKCEATVLISGESGTGKEMYAHGIHRASSRNSKPFVKVDCTSLPENLMEIELFGYEKGAVPGSTRSKSGKVELAHQGVLLLSEVCELTPYIQAKLVRFMQDGEFEKYGGNQLFQADVRVMATSSRSLRDAVKEGLFREDLYFKLSVIEIKVPPLRVRNEDIKVLAKHFVDKFNKKFGKTARGISSEVLQLLVEYEWPGNIRELECVLERAMVNMEGEFVHTWHLAPYIGQFGNLGSNRSMEVMPLDKMEQILLNAALTRYGESLEGKKKAAQALNISLATLYNKLRKYKGSSSS